jgi:hypothetical protein
MLSALPARFAESVRMAFDRQGQINAPAISNPSDNNKNFRVPEFRPSGIWKVCLGISTSENRWMRVIIGRCLQRRTNITHRCGRGTVALTVRPKSSRLFPSRPW